MNGDYLDYGCNTKKHAWKDSGSAWSAGRSYNIRSNGALAGRNTTANIDIVTKQDKPGIDIIIKPGTKKWERSHSGYIKREWTEWLRI